MKYFLIISFFCFLNCSGINAQQNEKEDSPLGYLEGASISEGEKLFVGNCAKCHEVCEQQLGPPLTDVVYKRPFPWLVRFIQNSSEVIKSGDEYAIHLYDAYNRMRMPPFPELNENDIKNILAYIHNESAADRKDTIIENTAEVSEIIQKARNNAFGKEGVNYYEQSTEHEIPVDEGSALNGKGLFNQFCDNCHEVCQSDVGPALAGISKRRPLSWLLAFINNPAEVVKTGDSYSNYLVSNYDLLMPGFEYINTEQKLDILAYIRLESAGEVSSSGVNSQTLKENNRIDSSQLANEADDGIADETDIRKEPKIDRDALKWIFIPLILIVFGYIGFFIFKYFRKKR